MIVRSKAPLRIGLAGGGTDVSPYSDIYGGAILNATINKYAYATIIPKKNGKIVLHSIDKNQKITLDSSKQLVINGELDLLKGVYNRIIKDYAIKPLSFEMSTFVDAPAGSGLGTSSTLVVAILGAFAEWLNLPMGEYDLANLAFEIERVDLNMSGGKQDQYAATFGGVNFMEFYKDNKVIVNPLRIKDEILHELEFNLVLYYTETSRFSSAIIDAQTKNVRDKKKESIDAMHKLKEQATMMKDAILTSELPKIGEILDFGWQYKKQMAKGISTPFLDQIYESAKKNGASGGKISGAGGGGFMFFYCPLNTRYKVINNLQKLGGKIYEYGFTQKGLTTWKL